MKKKQIYTLLFSAAICSESYSGTMGVENSEISLIKENLYLGVGVGGRFSRDKLSHYISTITPITYFKETVETSQAVGNLYFGLGHTWMNKYYLGVEGSAYFPNYTIYPKGFKNVYGYTQFTETYMFSNSWGVDLMPGIRFEPRSLIFARVGLASRDVKNGESYPPYSGHQTGGRFGVGVAYELTRHIGISFDYFYTYYPEYNPNFDNNLFGPSDYYAINLNSSQNYFGVSLIYSL